MTDLSLGSGPGETVLPAVPADWSTELATALGSGGAERRRALSAVAAAHPTSIEVWARLSEGAEDPVAAYAFARVGYHRGLDQLRAAGWRGSGYVRWRHPENRGFLRALEALRAAAAAIGEGEEEELCGRFLRQLDPEWRFLPPEG